MLEKGSLIQPVSARATLRRVAMRRRGGVLRRNKSFLYFYSSESVARHQVRFRRSCHLNLGQKL
jgi:hypothetical protein